MNFENGENVLPGTQEKIKEYIDRVKNGEDLNSLQLPPKMFEAVTERLKEDSESDQLVQQKIQIDEQKIKERESEDQIKIDALKKEISSFGVEKQLNGIRNTFINIATGAKEGLQDDFKRKIQKYVDEIRSGKDMEHILNGLPEKWKQVVKEKLANSSNAPEDLVVDLEKRKEIGQQVLAELNKLSSDMHLSGGHAIIGGTWNGDFRGEGDATLEVDENQNIVLRRGARDEKSLTKEGLVFTNKQDLYDSSLTNGVGNGVPTASNSKIGESYTYNASPEYMGVFRIPHREFLDLAKEGKIMLGNLSESEIVISPEVASKYLSEINRNKV